ncbi:hypothetical protein JCM9957A_40710 [Kineosporia succinea]
MVARGTERDHQLQLAGVVLVERVPHRLLEMPLLVEHAEHDADRHVSGKLIGVGGGAERLRQVAVHVARQPIREEAVLRARIRRIFPGFSPQTPLIRHVQNWAAQNVTAKLCA